MVDGIETSDQISALRALLDASSDGAALVVAGRVAWWNRGLEDLAGGQTFARRPWEHLFVDRGFGLPLRRDVIECGLERGGAEAIPVAVTFAPIPDAPEVDAYCVRDLRVLQTLEDEVLRSGRTLHARNRELAAARERLQRDGAERDELLNVVSHELRTPVTVIRGYNRLLLEEGVGPLNDQQRHFLEESQKSCLRLDTFIGNLFEAARKGTATGPLEVREGEIREVLEGVGALLRPVVADRELRLEIHCAPGAPRVRFDPQRIEQVLVNLVNNAARVAPAGSAICVRAEPAERGGAPMLRVSVEDAGPGIPRALRERIFEPYVQGEAGREGGGLGLGLAICRRIVEAHGGEIAAIDAAEPGACVAFWLPVRDTEGSIP